MLFSAAAIVGAILIAFTMQPQDLIGSATFHFARLHDQDGKRVHDHDFHSRDLHRDCTAVARHSRLWAGTGPAVWKLLYDLEFSCVPALGPSDQCFYPERKRRPIVFTYRHGKADNQASSMSADFGRLTKALLFAAEAHRNQRRKGAAQEPYLNHLIEVLDLVVQATGETDMDLTVEAADVDRLCELIEQRFPAATVQPAEAVYERGRRSILIARIRTDSTDAVVDLAQRLCVVFRQHFVGIEVDGRYIRIYADDTDS